MGTSHFSPIVSGSADFFLTHMLSYFYKISMFYCGKVTITFRQLQFNTITYYVLYLIF